MTSVCNAYYQFRFEPLRTINTETNKPAFNRNHWADTCAYIAETASIEEVTFSGSEPLMLSDGKLRQCLMDIRAIRPELLIRVHSRALTFNPYRITEEQLQSLADAGVSGSHPSWSRMQAAA